MRQSGEEPAANEVNKLLPPLAMIDYQVSQVEDDLAAYVQ